MSGVFTKTLLITQLLEFWISNKQNKRAKSDKRWGMGAEIWPTIRTFFIKGNKVLYINQNSKELKKVSFSKLVDCVAMVSMIPKLVSLQSGGGRYRQQR